MKIKSKSYQYDNLFIFFLIILSFSCSYFMMIKFIKKNNIKLEKNILPRLSIIDLPLTYLEAYRSSHGKMGPGIKI